MALVPKKIANAVARISDVNLAVKEYVMLLIFEFLLCNDVVEVKLISVWMIDCSPGWSECK